jgi:leucyl-tRNA synthetase
MPADLDIDRKAQLLNTMAPYAQQVVVCTGQDDWASNIQQDESATGEFVRGVKDVIGKGAKAFDVGWFSHLY